MVILVLVSKLQGKQAYLKNDHLNSKFCSPYPKRTTAEDGKDQNHYFEWDATTTEENRFIIETDFENDPAPPPL